MLTQAQKKRIRGFVNLLKYHRIGGSDIPGSAKGQFKTDGRYIVKLIAQELALPPETYSIRWNAGGIAVSGEVTLHSDRLYLQFYQSAIGGEPSQRFLFRSCQGQRDYTGGPNQWAAYSELLDLDRLVYRLRTQFAVEHRGECPGCVQCGRGQSDR